jgi:hypothetical protein
LKLTREQFEHLKTIPIFKGKIVTGSMVPVIGIGENIVVEVGTQELSRFDIIVFYQGEKLVCHYLWRLNRRVEPILMQTRSLSGGRDYPIGIQDYLGKVISHRLPTWRKWLILLK